MPVMPPTYLSFQPGDPSKPTFSPDINKYSTFKQTGTWFALEGVVCGYNRVVFGIPTPGGRVNYDPTPRLLGQVDPPINLSNTATLIPVGDEPNVYALKDPS